MAEADHATYAVVLGEVLLKLRSRRIQKEKPKEIPKSIKITSKDEQIGFVVGVSIGSVVVFVAHLDLVYGLFGQLLPGQLAFFIQAPFQYLYYVIIVVFGIMARLVNIINKGYFEDKRKGVSNGMLWAIITVELVLFFIYPEVFTSVTNCCDWSV